MCTLVLLLYYRLYCHTVTTAEEEEKEVVESLTVVLCLTGRAPGQSGGRGRRAMERTTNTGGAMKGVPTFIQHSRHFFFRVRGGAHALVLVLSLSPLFQSRLGGKTSQIRSSFLFLSPSLPLSQSHDVTLAHNRISLLQLLLENSLFFLPTRLTREGRKGR